MQRHLRHLRRLGGAVVVTAAIAALLTAAPAEAARQPPAPNCGTKILKPSGSSWTCTFVDNFDGYKLDTGKWFVQLTDGSGFGGGGDCFVNTANNVSVGNGVLSLTTRKEATPFTCRSPYGNFTTSWTSGMVSTYTKFSQTYGRFEIRAKFPAAKVAGLQSALWLWPANPSKYGSWPTSGEIDIAEFYSINADRAIPYIHYDAPATDDTVTNNFCMITDTSAFHSYVAEWTPSAITITYDGKTCVTHTINPLAPLLGSAPFDQPFIIALTQALGVGDNSVTATTPTRATTQVDYVRVWK
jgi:beta-glucanase (GH16 family)